MLAFGNALSKKLDESGDKKAVEDFRKAQEDLDKAKRGGTATTDTESKKVQEARNKLEKRGINPESEEFKAWLKGAFGSVKRQAAKGAEKGKSGLSRFVDENRPTTGYVPFDGALQGWAEERIKKEGLQDHEIATSPNTGPIPAE